MEATQKLSEVGAAAGKAAATAGKAAAKAAWATVANVFGFGAKIEDYPYRLLLIGETGAGKTSFLDLLCNCGMEKMLDREFDIELLRDFHDATLENASSRKMESKTSGAKLYSAVLGEMKIGIIDTPGFGDSRGLEQDERNVKSIIDVLREEEYVNCVCLVVNGRQSRINATLQYVLSEITAVLPKKIIGNVIVVFTNTANPLNLNFDLEQLRPFFGQTVIDDHTFCIENPYSTLEKAKMKYGQLPTGVIAKSLKKSFEETAEVLDEMSKTMKDFKKVYTHDFISLYEKKQKIEEGVVIMLTEIENQKRIEKAIADAQELAEAALRKKTLNNNFTVVQTYTSIEVVPTKHHNTLCNAENCTSNCHEQCGLERSLSSEIFRRCACMDGGTYCTECGHHYTHHYHMEKRYAEKTRERQFVDKAMRRRFNEAKTMEDRARIFKETLEVERKKSEKIRKDFGDKLLELLEEYHKLGMARNYAKVIETQVEVIKRRFKGTVGPLSRDLQETKEKLEQKLQAVYATLQEPLSSNDTSWACNILQLNQSQKPITTDTKEIKDAPVCCSEGVEMAEHEACSGTSGAGEDPSSLQLTTADVIHAYDVSLRASKEKEQQLQSQLATVEQESQDKEQQLSKLKDENHNLHKKMLTVKYKNEQQQEELKRLQQKDGVRLTASKEEQQQLVQQRLVQQYQRMGRAKDVQISQLQNENEILQDKYDTLKASTEKQSVHAVDTGVQADYLAVIAPGFLRGVEVYGETVLEVVGDKPQKLEWPGYGFYMEVPEGALTTGITASVGVKVILSGKFKLPDNRQLISAIYWISSSEVFLKEVAINIQHFAVVMSKEQCSKFSFIIAKCSQKELPYTFREREGSFNPHTQYGTIKLKQFSLVGETSPEGTELCFTSLKFYKPMSSTLTMVDYIFVVVYNHELFLEFIRKEYHGYSEDKQNQLLVFEDNVMVLDLPAGDSPPKVVDGWKILPLTHPQVPATCTLSYMY